MIRLTIILVLFSVFLYGQDKKGNVFTNAGDAAKMALGKQKLYANELVSALNTFKEVEQNNPKDAGVKYYVGLCQFNLGQYANAKESMLKAVEINSGVKPETHLILGRLYQLEENFDKAIAELNLFKASNTSDKENAEDADVFLSQCQNAKTMMASPADVQVMNLGDGINSRWDDKNPCVTADGRKMVFTTRRPENTNSPTDLEGDGKYFENIFIADVDSATGNFINASPVPGSINTPAHDACTSISPDGKQIFIYYNDANVKEKRGGNIFVSKVTGGKWRTPESLGKPINTSYWEGGACVSPDGKRYFFTSEREGGYGKSDIYMVEKINKKEWGKPVNLGPEINSPYDEGGMFLAPDGKTLFFCSNGPKSMGSYDVLRSIYENGKWSAPENLGYPINSIGKEGQLSISADARYAYVSSDRKGGLGETDIYRIDLRNFAILEKDFRRQNTNGLSILRGTIREGFEGYGLQDVEVLLKDDKDQLVSSTSTNENGEYFFTTPPGKYLLTVRKKGFQEINDNVEVTAGQKETMVVEKGYLLKK